MTLLYGHSIYIQGRQPETESDDEQDQRRVRMAASHGCEFAVENFALVGFTREDAARPYHLCKEAHHRQQTRKTQPIIRPDISCVISQLRLRTVTSS